MAKSDFSIYVLWGLCAVSIVCYRRGVRGELTAPIQTILCMKVGSSQCRVEVVCPGLSHMLVPHQLFTMRNGVLHEHSVLCQSLKSFVYFTSEMSVFFLQFSLGSCHWVEVGGDWLEKCAVTYFCAPIRILPHLNLSSNVRVRIKSNLGP